MNKTGTFLFLGSGGSMGIPVIGCRCPVCRSDSPYNKRMRPSGLITIGHKQLLIDCGPDFRTQALKFQVDHLDGLLLTHAHHDHIAGIDELRIFFIRSKKPIPCLLSKQTAVELRTRFSYIFQESIDPEKLITKISLQQLESAHGTTEFQGVPISYVTYEQAGMLVNGYRFGDFAYISDIRYFSETIYQQLQGIKTLVISALRYEPSPFHLSIGEAIDFARKVGAKQTWLTHIAHELDHDETNKRLPADVRMAYDGLEFTFSLEN